MTFVNPYIRELSHRADILTNEFPAINPRLLFDNDNLTRKYLIYYVYFYKKKNNNLFRKQTI